MAKKDTVKVKIGFDADLSKVGQTVDLPVDEARVKVAEGRARYVGQPPAAASATPEPTTTPPMPEVIDGGDPGTPAEAAPSRKTSKPATSTPATAPAPLSPPDEVA